MDQVQETVANEAINEIAEMIARKFDNNPPEIDRYSMASAPLGADFEVELPDGVQLRVRLLFSAHGPSLG